MGYSTVNDKVMDVGELSTYLARKIFEAPILCGKTDVTRICFKGDVSPNTGQERDYGGLCEDALIGVIRRALEDREHV